ncbi:MAG: 50S ribosomal protein L20 [Chitinivibrionales bacterium]|nr:50S ribosomal protein L20 [Chitinivibrionales bacterium]
MPRAKTRVASRNRRKNILKSTKGYYGKRKSCIRTATDAMWKSGTNAYRDRKQRKRNFRSLWIMRINAAARENGMTYGRFMSALSKKGIELNRKSLAWLAVNEPEAFKKLVEEVKE